MIREQFLSTSRGGIVYDAARLRKPEAGMFTRAYWQERSQLESMSGGRGTVSVLHSQEGDWILRHYKRGGLAARISADRYLWLGANATRSLREWRLLAQLHDRGLPVPAPIAARYERTGLLYRADIITARLSHARTLAQVIAEKSLDATAWRHIGQTIARFHAVGVHHADLNANNIMLTDDAVYLLDFDRGRIRARGAWEGDVIARLQRSLEKLRTKHPELNYGEREWQALLAGVNAAVS